MRAGPLRRRIDIRRPVRQQSGLGEVQTVDWEIVHTLRARIDVKAGGKDAQVPELHSQVDTEITTYYREGVDSTMQVRHLLHEGSPTEYEYFEILAVAPNQWDRRSMVLHCRRRDATGFRGQTNYG